MTVANTILTLIYHKNHPRNDFCQASWPTPWLCLVSQPRSCPISASLCADTRVSFAPISWPTQHFNAAH